jgi:hypothetical protein
MLLLLLTGIELGPDGVEKRFFAEARFVLVLLLVVSPWLRGGFRNGILLLSGRFIELGPPFAVAVAARSLCRLWNCVVVPVELTRLALGGDGALRVDFQLDVFAESLSKKLRVSEGRPRSRRSLFASRSKSASDILLLDLF